MGQLNCDNDFRNFTKKNKTGGREEKEKGGGVGLDSKPPNLAAEPNFYSCSYKTAEKIYGYPKKTPEKNVALAALIFER